jgi:hypothetical protein
MLAFSRLGSQRVAAGRWERWSRHANRVSNQAAGRRILFAGTRMGALVQRSSAVSYPALLPGHGFGAIPAPCGKLALLLRQRRPAGYGIRTNLVREVQRKDFSRASVNAELRHLGAGPLAWLRPVWPEQDREIQQTETRSCTRIKSTSSDSSAVTQKFTPPTTAASPPSR